MLVATAQPHARERRRSPRTLLAERQSPVTQRKLCVFQRTGSRDQIEVLEDEADLPAPQLGQFVLAGAPDIPPVQPVCAPGRPVEAPEQIHERGLPGAGCAHHRDELSSLDLEADAAQRLDLDVAEPVHLPDILADDQRAHRSVKSRAPSVEFTAEHRIWLVEAQHSALLTKHCPFSWFFPLGVRIRAAASRACGPPSAIRSR